MPKSDGGSGYKHEYKITDRGGEVVEVQYRKKRERSWFPNRGWRDWEYFPSALRDSGDRYFKSVEHAQDCIKEWETRLFSYPKTTYLGQDQTWG